MTLTHQTWSLASARASAPPIWAGSRTSTPRPPSASASRSKRVCGSDVATARPLAVERELRVTDLSPAAVVADDARERQAEAHRRLELHPVQPQGTVAGDQEDTPFRMEELRGERERRADAETAERPGVEPLPRPVESHDLRGAADDVAAVADDDRLRRHDARDLRGEAVVRHRHLLGGAEAGEPPAALRP